MVPRVAHHETRTRIRSPLQHRQGAGRIISVRLVDVLASKQMHPVRADVVNLDLRVRSQLPLNRESPLFDVRTKPLSRLDKQAAESVSRGGRRRRRKGQYVVVRV